MFSHTKLAALMQSGIIFIFAPLFGCWAPWEREPRGNLPPEPRPGGPGAGWHLGDGPCGWGRLQDPAQLSLALNWAAKPPSAAAESPLHSH